MGDARRRTERRDHLEVFLGLAGRLAADIDEVEVVRVLLDAAAVGLDAPFGQGVLLQSVGHRIVASAGDDAAIATSDVAPLAAWAAEAERTGTIQVVPDVAVDGRFPCEPAPSGRRRVCAGLAVPLVYGGRVLATLATGFSAPREFTADELGLVGGLASFGAVALERARIAGLERSARGTVEAVLGQIPLGIEVTDVHGGTLFRNQALDAISHGVPPTEGLAELGRWQGIHADGRPYRPDEWPGVRCLTGESIVDEEIAIVRLDGSRGVISVRAEPIRDPGGAIIGGVTAVIDVTQRREADAMRDAFINVLSHELRTPVTSMYGAGKVLAARWRTLTDAQRDGLLADIAAESDRLQRLVQDLVVLAEVERGVDLSVSEPVLVQHRLRAVAAAMTSEWPDRRFIVEAPEDVPPAVGEESYVEQVLRNLLGNAAKYGRSEVRASVSFDDEWVEVAVHDDGPGIEPGDAERLFDLFYRSPTAGPLPGVGIGLFVARRLVTAMGGRVIAADRPGDGGGEFRLSLRRFPGAGVDPP